MSYTLVVCWHGGTLRATSRLLVAPAHDRHHPAETAEFRVAHRPPTFGQVLRDLAQHAE